MDHNLSKLQIQPVSVSSTSCLRRTNDAGEICLVKRTFNVNEGAKISLYWKVSSILPTTTDFIEIVMLNHLQK